MTMENNGRRIEYIADGINDTYVYPFEIFESTDLTVYLDSVLTLAYTVTGVGDTNGGTIVFTDIPVIDTQIIINSNIPPDQTVDFEVGGRFQPSTVNFVNDKLTALIQQTISMITNRGLLYAESDYLDNSVDQGDNVLPVLPLPTTGFIPIWTKNSDGNLSAVLLEEDPDSSTLRSELANDGNGTDGARIVGYYNTTSPTDDTVDAALSDLYTRDSTSIADITALETSVANRINPNLLPAGNILLNPWQRGTSFTSATTPNNNDGTYTADRIVLLSDGNNIVNVAGSTGASLTATQVTLNKQFGFVIFLENKDTIPLRIGQLVKTVSLSIDMACSVTKTFRAALLNWTSTADSPTKDVVSAWNGSGANPTLVANYAYINTPSDLTVTSTSTLFTISNITVPNTTNNLAVFLWLDSTTIAAATVFTLGHIKLERGTEFTGYSYPSFEQQLAYCQRYYEKSYNTDVKPGTVSIPGKSIGLITNAETEATEIRTPFRVTKRATPTVTWYNPQGGDIDSVYLYGTGNDGVSAQNMEGMNSTGYPSLTGTPAGTSLVEGHWTAESELGV